MSAFILVGRATLPSSISIDTTPDAAASLVAGDDIFIAVEERWGVTINSVDGQNVDGVLQCVLASGKQPALLSILRYRESMRVYGGKSFLLLCGRSSGNCNKLLFVAS